MDAIAFVVLRCVGCNLVRVRLPGVEAANVAEIVRALRPAPVVVSRQIVLIQAKLGVVSLKPAVSVMNRRAVLHGEIRNRIIEC